MTAEAIPTAEAEVRSHCIPFTPSAVSLQVLRRVKSDGGSIAEPEMAAKSPVPNPVGTAMGEQAVPGRAVQSLALPWLSEEGQHVSYHHLSLGEGLVAHCISLLGKPWV